LQRFGDLVLQQPRFHKPYKDRVNLLFCSHFGRQPMPDGVLPPPRRPDQKPQSKVRPKLKQQPPRPRPSSEGRGRGPRPRPSSAGASAGGSSVASIASARPWLPVEPSSFTGWLAAAFHSGLVPLPPAGGGASDASAPLPVPPLLPLSAFPPLALPVPPPLPLPAPPPVPLPAQRWPDEKPLPPASQGSEQPDEKPLPLPVPPPVPLPAQPAPAPPAAPSCLAAASACTA